MCWISISWLWFLWVQNIYQICYSLTHFAKSDLSLFSQRMKHPSCIVRIYSWNVDKLNHVCENSGQIKIGVKFWVRRTLFNFEVSVWNMDQQIGNYFSSCSLKLIWFSFRHVYFSSSRFHLLGDTKPSFFMRRIQGQVWTRILLLLFHIVWY